MLSTNFYLGFALFTRSEDGHTSVVFAKDEMRLDSKIFNAAQDDVALLELGKNSSLKISQVIVSATPAARKAIEAASG